MLTYSLRYFACEIKLPYIIQYRTCELGLSHSRMKCRSQWPTCFGKLTYSLRYIYTNHVCKTGWFCIYTIPHIWIWTESRCSHILIINWTSSFHRRTIYIRSIIENVFHLQPSLMNIEQLWTCCIPLNRNLGYCFIEFMWTKMHQLIEQLT